jgi:hypothetical protein
MASGGTGDSLQNDLNCTMTLVQRVMATISVRLGSTGTAAVVRIVWIIILALPPLALLLYVHNFGRNTFFWDDFDLVPLIEKMAKGTLTVSDLFAQHNEHRQLFPYAVILIIGGVTQYNTLALMYFSWALIVLTSVVLFLAYWHSTWSAGSRWVVLTFLPVEMLLFSFRQYESILWAFTSEIYVMIFAVLVALTLLGMSKKLDHLFVLSILSAIVASFSFAVGMAVWPAGLVQILDVRTKFKKSLLWCVSGSITVACYFIGYISPGNSPPITYVLSHPLNGIIYFLTLIGGPLSDDVRTAATYGAFIAFVGVVVLLWLAKNREMLRQHQLMISLIIFALLYSIATTVGRSGVGIQFATTSRYTPIVSLGLCGLYLCAASIYRRFPNKSGMGSFYHMLLALILVGLILSNSVGWQMGESTKQSRELGQYVLATYQLQSDENLCRYVYPCSASGVYFKSVAQLTRERADFLQRYGLNVFSQPFINTTRLKMNLNNTPSAIDTIDGTLLSNQSSPHIISSSQQTITITGWAVDKPRNDLAFAVFINVDGTTDIPAVYGIFQRPDIASAFKNPRLVDSGFWASFSTSVFGKGEHTIRLKIVSSDQSSFYLSQQIVAISVTQ